MLTFFSSDIAAFANCVFSAGIGTASTLPALLLCQKAQQGKRPQIATGLAALLFSAAVISVYIAILQNVVELYFMQNALICVFAFLLVWCIQAVRALAWMRKSEHNMAQAHKRILCKRALQDCARGQEDLDEEV